MRMCIIKRKSDGGVQNPFHVPNLERARGLVKLMLRYATTNPEVFEYLMGTFCLVGACAAIGGCRHVDQWLSTAPKIEQLER
jgi:hypothetical protein